MEFNTYNIRAYMHLPYDQTQGMECIIKCSYRYMIRENGREDLLKNDLIESKV